MARTAAAPITTSSPASRSALRANTIASPPNLFLWGIGGVLLSVLIVFVDPREPTPLQAAVIATLLGLSGAAFATAISGIIKIRTKAISAGGPFAIFILVFWGAMGAGAPGVLPDFNSILLRGR